MKREEPITRTQSMRQPLNAKKDEKKSSSCWNDGTTELIDKQAKQKPGALNSDISGPAVFQ